MESGGEESYGEESQAQAESEGPVSASCGALAGATAGSPLQPAEARVSHHQQAGPGALLLLGLRRAFLLEAQRAGERGRRGVDTLASQQAGHPVNAASRKGPGMCLRLAGLGPLRVILADLCAQGRRGEAGRQQDREFRCPSLRPAHHGVNGDAPGRLSLYAQVLSLLILPRLPAETYA